MRRAARIGGWLLLSLWGQSCSEARVDLEGLGAGGSAAMVPMSKAPPMAAPPSRRAEAPLITVTAPSTPATSAAPSPYAGLTSRDPLTPPIAGGTLAVAADGSIAVAGDPDRDQVHLVDLVQATARALPLPAASEPGRVVLDGAGNAHVVLRGTGQLARIELATPRSTLSKHLCDHPRGLAFDAAADALVLACADGALLTLDPGSYAVRDRQSLARDLRDVVIGASSERFVTRFRSGELLHLDAHGKLLDQTKPLQLPRPVMTSAPKAGVAMVNTSATLAYRTVAAPGGELWMVHQRVQDDALEQNESYTGTLGCGPIAQPSLTHFDARGEVADSLLVHRPATLAVDVAVSADGQWLALATPGAWVTNGPSVRLQRTDMLIAHGSIATNAVMAGELLDFQQSYCAAPNMIELMTGTQATAVAYDAQGRLYVQQRVPARLDVMQPPWDAQKGGAQRARSIALADTPVRDLGHELFHGDAGSDGLSCASCHGEGQDDAHVWQFTGAGARRTLSLRGGLLETLPLQWAGEFATFEDLALDLLHNRMGANRFTDMPVSALGAWLEKLPALRLSAPDRAAAERGEALFTSAAVGCSGCHTGAALSNNQSMDVGTGGAYQVPSLRGLALRAPFMHDGCASSVRDSFLPGCGGDDRHGHAAQLTAAEQSDLIAYLESL